MARWLSALCKWSTVVVGLFSVGCASSLRDTNDERFLIGRTACEFSFSLPAREWAPDPKSTTYSNIPVLVPKSEIASPRLFFSMNRFWRDDKSAGGWMAAAKDKCQLAARDVIQTRDGKEARIFLASACDVSEAVENGQFKSPFRGHTLYGYVVVNDTEADFLYLSSVDPALLRQHEGVLLSALRSYSTSSPSCVARRTTVKKFEVAGRSAHSETFNETGTRALASRIHPEFIQNLQHQLANIGSRDRISAMAYDPRSDFFLVGRDSGSIDIWDGKHANARREIKAPEPPIRLTFSSDGRVFFSSYHAKDVTHAWDAASGSILHTIEHSRGPVVATSDPNLFVLAADGGLRIFDLARKELLPGTWRRVGDSVTAMAYDMPTDQLAVGTASGGVEVWKLTKSSKPVLERVAAAVPYAMGNWVRDLQFFNGGHSLYSLPQRGDLDEWSTARLERLRSREVSLRFVGRTVFMPDEGLLAMAGIRKGDDHTFDNFLEILNLKEGSRYLVDLKEGGGGPIAYLPSLSTIISGSGLTISTIEIGKQK
ncbi:MAG: hypothetical protein V4864_22950 [Pseudomonadota bacterium]